MKLPGVLLVLTIANSMGPSLARAECNFDKPVGSCEGSVTLLSSGGSKPSFNAEVEITSSAGSCSKVEYFVNSTPYTSIIRSNGAERESLSGTSPITSKDLKVSKCTAYAQPGAEQKNISHDAASYISVDGAWYNVQDLGASGTHEMTLTIQEKNGKISAMERMVAYWGPDSNRKQYSQVMTAGARWTGQREGNVITSDGGTKYTIINENTIRADYGDEYTR